MKRLIFTILALFAIFQTAGLAQNITVSGIVADANDGSPVPGVNVFTRSRLSGTVIGLDGRFTLTLPQKYYGSCLFFSSIGYKTDSIKINKSAITVSLKLTPDIYPLGEVVVMPDNALQTLLGKAFRQIPENYPTQPVNYEVFYRETEQNSNGAFIAIAEALFSIFKNSYNKPHDPGQVMVVKSRKSMTAEYDSIVPVRFYNGPYSFINGDYVFTRSEVIHPKYFNRFHYQMAGITRFDGKDTYMIDFHAKKTDYNGRLYIDKQSLAYVKIEMNHLNTATKQKKNFDREKINYRIQYAPVQGKWHLQHLTYTDVKHMRETDAIIHNSVEQITYKIDTDSVQPIPYGERLNYYEPFLQTAKQYDPEFWAGYSVLEQDSSMRQTLETLFNKEVIGRAISTLGINTVTPAHGSNARRTWMKAALNMYAGLGIDYSPFSSIGGNYTFGYTSEQGQNIILAQNKNEKRSDIGITSLLGYHLSKHISLYCSGNLNIPFASRLHVDDIRLGAEYRRNIKSKGHPLFAGFSLDLGWDRHFVDLGDAQNTIGKFKAGGKTVDANRLNIQAGVKRMKLSPGFSLSASISRLIEVELYAQYDLVLTKRQVVEMKEKDGFFLFRKTATLSGDYLQVTDPQGKRENEYLKMTPFQLGLMIKYR